MLDIFIRFKKKKYGAFNFFREITFFLPWFSSFKKKVFKKFSGKSNILDLYIVYHD